MSVLVDRSNKQRVYKSLFTSTTSIKRVEGHDKIASKMTAIEELEKREKEIKSMLELSETLEERKALRGELREIRRKIFDGPTITTPTSPTKKEKSLPTNVKEENAKNLDLNSNYTSVNNDKNIKQETSAAPTKDKMSVSRRSRLFENTDDNNNSSSTSNTSSNDGLKLKIANDGGVEVKTRDAGDRAARRARRAQMMKEMSVDDTTKTNGSIAVENKTSTPETTSIVIETPKEEVGTGTSLKVNGSIGLKVGGKDVSESDKSTQSSTALRRTATWGGSKDRTSASNTIGKALNNNARSKFGAQETKPKPRPTSTYSTNRLSTTSSALRRAASPTPSRKVEPPPPQPPPPEPAADNPMSFGGGAVDRMAFFRQAAQKEKEAAEKKKEREEQRRKQQEMINAALNGEVEVKEDKKEEQKKEDTKRPSQKKEMTDSEKMKHASAPCMKKREKKKVVRRTMSIGSIVLDWVQEMIKDYPIQVTNFSSSWNNGLAFCALIHRFNPEEFDFNELTPENKRHNFDLAFNTGMKCKNIPVLLDTEDMVAMTRPEPRSVQTYIQWIWSVYGPTSGYGPTPKEVQK